jgi:uncharacterized protein (TIGR03083 family)
MADDALHREPDWYLEHLRVESARMADALGTGPLDAAVAACPGWDVAKLARHTGGVFRWAAFCAREGRAPTPDESAAMPAFDADDVPGWFRGCADDIVDALGSLDPAAPTWHPFPAEQVGAFWFRRMAHEAAMHRWDAEHAIGTTTPIDPELASDGIDEYFETMIPRGVVRDGAELPTSSFHVHCTDVDGEWLVWTEDGEYRMIRAHQKGDAALRGPAEQLLLALWARDADDDALSSVGDAAVPGAWSAIGA